MVCSWEQSPQDNLVFCSNCISWNSSWHLTSWGHPPPQKVHFLGQNHQLALVLQLSFGLPYCIDTPSNFPLWNADLFPVPVRVGQNAWWINGKLNLIWLVDEFGKSLTLKPWLHQSDFSYKWQAPIVLRSNFSEGTTTIQSWSHK